MFVSVVIPVYNDPDGLEVTLESLLDQTASGYEVIIADNGSTDDTPNVIQQYVSANTHVKTVTEDDVQSSYAARNAGIKAAKGEIIAFIDADMWVKSDYIKRIKQVMQESDYPYVGCDVEVVTDDSKVGRYNAISGFPVERYLTERQFAPTCCLVVDQTLFETVGLFDDRLVSNGDREFGNRVVNAGYDLCYEPRITVYHPARDTVQSMISKKVRIGRGSRQLRKYHPDLFNDWPLYDPRHVLPPNPIVFRNTFSGKGRNLQEYALWYALAWLLKFAGFWGKIKEYAA